MFLNIFLLQTFIYICINNFKTNSMSRQIKFRAWDNINNEMVYESSAKKFFERFTLSGDIIKKFEIIMQFTGLLDKNGKEIYMGDIVQLIYAPQLIGEIKELKGGAYYINHDDAILKYVHQIHCEVCNTNRTRFLLAFYEPYELEIIGNIHETPELLK